MLRLLSYPIRPSDPTFMSYTPPQIETLQSIARRNNTNTRMYHLHSNTGTHLIAPRHVHENGYDVAQLQPEHFHYERPVLIDVRLPQTWLIGEEQLSEHAEAIGKADLLLVRTGFSEMREKDPSRYGAGNPGFDVSAATYLIEKFPDLKAVGMDFPYPSSAHHLSRGLAFQQIILGASNRERFILLIAGLNLEGDFTGLQEVWALPLRVEGGPAAPCTVVARFSPGTERADATPQQGEQEAQGNKESGGEG